MRRLVIACLALLLAQDGKAAAPSTRAAEEPLPPGALARLGTARLRTTASALAFAPGGRTLLTAADGRTLGRHDAATGGLREETHLPGPVTDRAWFSPDGRT